MTSAVVHEGGLKEKALHELRRLTATFIYLAVFFTVFRLYTRLVLSEYQINYFVYGLTLLKSLALAKIIVTGEGLRLGEGTRKQPLIFTTVYFAVVFSLFALVFELLEHFILGWIRGKGPAEVFAEIADKGWPHLAAMTLVVFVAFLPYFAFRETARVLGEGKLRDLFFSKKGTEVFFTIKSATTQTNE